MTQTEMMGFWDGRLAVASAGSYANNLNLTPGASERFRKWGYKFVRTLYNLVVKVVC